jgi:ABC-2 type transport system ATP-binding protein
MEKNNKIIIETKLLTKKYKDAVALDNLNLQVMQGEIFGFLGHNGAGKTTTVNILTTLLAPTSGSATICGFDISKESMEVKKCIGYLPENVKFYDNLTAGENLEYFAKLSGIQNPREKIAEVLEFIEFTGIEDKKLGEFSKGCANASALPRRLCTSQKCCFWTNQRQGLIRWA